MNDTPDAEGLPPSLRFLKGLVIVLTVTMIAGVITVVGVIVTRMPDASRATPLLLPEAIILPAGTRAQAVTLGDDWIGVVTEDDRFLVFDRRTGTLRQDIAIAAP